MPLVFFSFCRIIAFILASCKRLKNTEYYIVKYLNNSVIPVIAQTTVLKSFYAEKDETLVFLKNYT